MKLKDEVLKRLTHATIMGAYNRVLHISHTDLDGYSPQVMMNIMRMNRNGDTFHVVNMNIEPGELFDTVMELYKNGLYKIYNVIIITDLSFKEKDLLELEKHQDLIDKLVLVDHHKNLDYLNNREWAHVLEEVDFSEMPQSTLLNTYTEVSAVSATELFGQYMLNIIDTNQHTFDKNTTFRKRDVINKLGRIVTYWDTWKWKTLDDVDEATFIRNFQRLFLWYKSHICCVNILTDIVLEKLSFAMFDILDVNVKGVVDSVILREQRDFVKFKKSLLSTKATMFDGTIVNIGYCYYKIKDLSGACDYVFENNPQYDLIIAIRPDNGLSYRVRPGFGLHADKLALAVNELCGVNAGGHPGAAGVSLDKELIKEAMMYYIDSSLEAISVLQRDK